MYREVEWMVPADHYILEELGDYGGWMKPASLALNLPFSANWIGQRCRALAEHDLLERDSDEGAYRITELGSEYLAGELDPGDIQRSDDD